MTSSDTAPGRVEDDAAVREVLDGVMAAWADNDASSFAAHYLEDATVLMPDGVFHREREAIRAYMAAAFDGRMKGSRSVDEPESVRVLGDAAVVVGRSGFLLPGEAEVPADRMRRATWVLARRAGRWWVAAYHNCPA